MAQQVSGTQQILNELNTINLGLTKKIDELREEIENLKHSHETTIQLLSSKIDEGTKRPVKTTTTEKPATTTEKGVSISSREGWFRQEFVKNEDFRNSHLTDDINKKFETYRKKSKDFQELKEGSDEFLDKMAIYIHKNIYKGDLLIGLKEEYNEYLEKNNTKKNAPKKAELPVRPDE